MPLRSTVINVPAGMSDEDIIKQATAEFMKHFRVEIEDIKNPSHHPYRKPTAEKEREPTRKEIMEKHGLKKGEYNYLRCIKKFSATEIFEKGFDLYVKRKNRRD